MSALKWSFVNDACSAQLFPPGPDLILRQGRF
jgi:hypothetical protein